MNYTESNRLIAHFMGMQKTKDGWEWFDAEEMLQLPYTTDNTFDKLLFDTSWDWLMPIVDIIRESGYRIELSHGGLVGRILETTNDSSDVVARVSSKAYGVAYEFDNPKEALYNLVVRFIKWSNESFRSN
jgi:hypothetical protein